MIDFFTFSTPVLNLQSLCMGIACLGAAVGFAVGLRGRHLMPSAPALMAVGCGIMAYFAAMMILIVLVWATILSLVVCFFYYVYPTLDAWGRDFGTTTGITFRRWRHHLFYSLGGSLRAARTAHDRRMQELKALRLPPVASRRIAEQLLNRYFDEVSQVFHHDGLGPDPEE